MRGWWRARWAESRPDLPGRLDGRDKEPGGASRQPLREKSLRGRAGTSGGRGRGVDREFEAIRAAGPEGSLRRPGHGSSRRGVSPGSDGNSKRFVRRARRDRSAVRSGKLGTGESAPGRTEIRQPARDLGGLLPPRRPRKLGTGESPRAGREFEAIGAAGPERSRRAGPEAREGVSPGPDGNSNGPLGTSERSLRRAVPEARDGGVSSGSDRFEAIRGGPGEIAPPCGPGSSGRGNQPRAGREFEAIGAAGPERNRSVARAPEAQDGGRQPRVGREFEAIRAAGPERSLRRVGPESSGPGVSSGSDGNSKRLARRARRNRSAAQARKLGTGESASGRTRIRGAFAAGPEGSLRRAGPGTPGETSQPCAGRAFETVAAASTQRRSRRRCSGRAATGSGSSSAARERTRAPQAIMA
jgi:hypothetical protein